MTKNRFYDILGDTLDIYNGVEKESLDQFMEMVESTALIRRPDGFETEYPDLCNALDTLKMAIIQIWIMPLTASWQESLTEVQSS